MHHLIVSTLIVILLLLFGLGCCHLLDLLAPGWARKGDVPFHGNQTDVEQGRARLLDPAAMRSQDPFPNPMLLPRQCALPLPRLVDKPPPLLLLSRISALAEGTKRRPR